MKCKAKGIQSCDSCIYQISCFSTVEQIAEAPWEEEIFPIKKCPRGSHNDMDCGGCDDYFKCY